MGKRRKRNFEPTGEQRRWRDLVRRLTSAEGAGDGEIDRRIIARSLLEDGTNELRKQGAILR